MSRKNIVMMVVALGLLFPNINFADTAAIVDAAVKQSKEFNEKIRATVDGLVKEQKWKDDVSKAEEKVNAEKKKFDKAAEEAAEPAEKKLKNKKDLAALAPTLKPSKFSADLDTDTASLAQGCNGDISVLKSETKPSKLMETVKQATTSFFSLSRDEKAILKIKLGQEADKEIQKLKDEEEKRLTKIQEVSGSDPLDPKVIKVRIELLKLKVADLQSQEVKLKIDRITKEKKLAELALDDDPDQAKLVAAEASFRDTAEQQVSFLTKAALSRDKEHFDVCKDNKRNASRLADQFVGIGVKKNENYIAAIAPNIESEINGIKCQSNRSQITALFSSITDQVAPVDASSSGAPIQLLINAQNMGDALVNASTTAIGSLKGSALACNKSAKIMEAYKEAVSREGGSVADSSSGQSSGQAGFGSSDSSSSKPSFGRRAGRSQQTATHN